MKKLKYAFWLIFVGFFALLIFQNLEFFSAKYRLQINLGFYTKQTPEMTNGAIMASFIAISVLIMLVFYLFRRFENYRANKTIRSLTHTLDESTAVITGLKQELETQQQGESVPIVEEATAAHDASSTESESQADTNPAPSI